MCLPCIRQGKRGSGVDDDDMEKARLAALEATRIVTMKRGVLG